MEPININNSLDEARSFRAQLLSLGYGVERATATAIASQYLSDGTLKLNQLSSEQELKDDEQEVGIGASAFLLNDAILLPAWINFAHALSSIPANKRGCISLIIMQMQLGEEVLALLLDSFKEAPLKRLILKGNQLGTDGINFVVEALKTNNLVENLGICDNIIQSDDEASSLINAVIKHPKVESLALNKCGLGFRNDVSKRIIPAVCSSLSLTEVSLCGNQIDSYGVKLISNSLAGNSTLKCLYLEDNLINDDDAKQIASALMTNTNLRKLNIAGNRITQVGIYSFMRALLNAFDFTSISANNVYNSNHTCLVNVGHETLLANLNTYVDSKLNRDNKLVSMLLPNDASYSNIRYFNNIPVETMPMVLAFLLENTRQELNAVFRLMQEWNMPLLYTRCIGPKLRRSKRIRQNMLRQYMEGN